MKQSRLDRDTTPVAPQADPEVVALREQIDDRSPLDELVLEGARRMLQEAIYAEVDSFIEQHRDRRDEAGRRLVVRNGSLPARKVVTGAGQIEAATKFGDSGHRPAVAFERLPWLKQRQ